MAFLVVDINEAGSRNNLNQCIATRNFEHENVMRILGIAFLEKQFYVVMPFVVSGDLRTFISSPTYVNTIKTQSTVLCFTFHCSFQDLTVLQLAKYGIQVASGMKYLSEKNLVHGDLAARNCMYENAELYNLVMDGNVTLSCSNLAGSARRASRSHFLR